MTDNAVVWMRENQDIDIRSAPPRRRFQLSLWCIMIHRQYLWIIISDNHDSYNLLGAYLLHEIYAVAAPAEILCRS